MSAEDLSPKQLTEMRASVAMSGDREYYAGLRGKLMATKPESAKEEKPMTLKTFAMALTVILDMPLESSYDEIISKVATLAVKR